jgi:ATP-dependent Lon protease
MSADAVEQATLPLMPTHSGVIVPGMVVNVILESDEAGAAVDAAQQADRRLVLVPYVDGRYAHIGTLAQLEHLEQAPDGRRAAMIRGVSRVEIGAGVSGDGHTLWVATRDVDELAADTERVQQLATEYRAVAEGVLGRRGGEQLAATLSGISDPSQLADTVVYLPELSLQRKVEALETLDVAQRLEKATAWAREALAEAETAERIRSEVTENMERTQREYVLRQQLQQIKHELGEGDDEDPAERYRAKLAELDERADGVPDEVRGKIEREIDRLERTSEQNPEHGWIRTWLDWMLEMPWGVHDPDRLDLSQARAILDADHTGLDEVKDRIVEQLAVRKLRRDRGLDRHASPKASHDDQAAEAPANPGEGGESRPGDERGEQPASEQPAGEQPAGEQEREQPAGDEEREQPAAARHAARGSGAILTLIGPPGVGKTSLGESVARALGRQFVRIALGGVHDEAEIRGHRRTYVGAQPGRIARAIRDAGAMNPVVVLDEVDKVGNDWRGDPSSALLEVLDPAQNHTFNDHYLEADLDLSDVLFIATGNVAETIPPALRDRMEVIRLDGYTDGEKAAIAASHLLPDQLERHGLGADEVTIDHDAFERVISEYTREAGVRELSRELAKLVRKVATRIASGETNPPVHVAADDVADLLGTRRYEHETREDITEPGVATGLAVTGAGGEVLFVETSVADGDAGLTLTGQLGDVMRESASIALDHVRARADRLGLSGVSFDRAFHVHVPAGATPKDGPSAGVAMTVALASLLSGRRVRSGVGMTGEVTLSGKVLPVGGIRAKVLAAHRAGLGEVILPQRNAPDLDDVPDEVRQAMDIHLVGDVGQALDVALEEASAQAA